MTLRGDERVVQLQRELRDVVGVLAIGVALQGEVPERGGAHVRQQRGRRAGQQAAAEEHPSRSPARVTSSRIEAPKVQQRLEHDGGAQHDVARAQP